MVKCYSNFSSMVQIIEEISCCISMLPWWGTGLGEAFMTTGENGDYEVPEMMPSGAICWGATSYQFWIYLTRSIFYEMIQYLLDLRVMVSSFFFTTYLVIFFLRDHIFWWDFVVDLNYKGKGPYHVFSGKKKHIIFHPEKKWSAVSPVGLALRRWT